MHCKFYFSSLDEVVWFEGFWVFFLLIYKLQIKMCFGQNGSNGSRWGAGKFSMEISSRYLHTDSLRSNSSGSTSHCRIVPFKHSRVCISPRNCFCLHVTKSLMSHAVVSMAIIILEKLLRHLIEKSYL